MFRMQNAGLAGDGGTAALQIQKHFKVGGPVCRPYGLEWFPYSGRPQGSPLRFYEVVFEAQPGGSRSHPYGVPVGCVLFVGAGHWPAHRRTLCTPTV